MRRSATYNPSWVNLYVPASGIVSEADNNGLVRVSLGSPDAGTNDAILAAVPADDTGPFTYELASFEVGSSFDGTQVLDAVYGRNVVFELSGPGTGEVTIIGTDYLHQPVKKTKAANGTTPVSFDVAFKTIQRVIVEAGAATTTINMGFDNNIGVPYKVVNVLSAEADGVSVSALPDVEAPDTTNPATDSTTDPRGMLSFTALTGAALEVLLICSSSVDADGDGGYHGIKHFFE